jgi:purine-binding chemotaxis protein CheW
MKPDSALPILLVKAAGHLVAVPVIHVIEVMRLLPIEALAGAPSFVRGMAVIRGQPVPVADLGALLLGTAPDPGVDSRHARFVALRLGTRVVALLVEAVLSFRSVAGQELHALPPLWAKAASPAVASLATLDRELMFVLEATRLAPEDWLGQTAARGEAG